jgi:cyclopropane fatty-acyl-phospholipid synthase-like methyltransferase
MFCMSDDPSRPRTATYVPHYYEVDSLELAKKMIVTGEEGMSSDERWALETPWIVDSIAQYLPMPAGSTLIDYGCGIGRIAKELIARNGCSITGIDTSHAMRQLAPQYVASSQFCARSPQELDEAVRDGFRADYCIAIWVLQHILKPLEAIARVASALRPNGRLYVLNMRTRSVPTNMGYANDGFDVQAALAEQFAEEHRFAPPEGVMPPALLANTVIQVLRKRPE